MLDNRNLLVRAGVCALALNLWAIDATAQPKPSLPGAETITAAARQGSREDISLALVSAIAKHPNETQRLVAFAVAQAPQHKDAIVTAAANAFPAFDDRIRKAASGKAVSNNAPRTVSVTRSNTTTPDKTPSTDMVWKGEIELGGSRATGNTETEKINAAAKINLISGPWDTTASAGYDFAKDSGDINAQRLRAGINTKYRYTDRAFAYGLIDYDDDRFSGFTYEITQSAGLGYRLIDTKDWEVEVSAGPALRISEIKSTGEQDVEPGARSDASIIWRISDNAQFSNTTSVTWGQERMITENTTALTMKIIGELSGRLSHNLRYNSEAPVGTESTDTLTKASLVYGF